MAAAPMSCAAIRPAKEIQAERTFRRLRVIATRVVSSISTLPGLHSKAYARAYVRMPFRIELNNAMWVSTTRAFSFSSTSVVHTSRCDVPPRMMPS